MKKLLPLLALIFVACNTTESRSATITGINGNQTQGIVVFSQRGDSIVVSGKFYNLSPGQHRFHIHEDPSCDNNGEDAGVHYDPIHTEQTTGHFLGRLPSLNVDEHGEATIEVIIDQLSLTEGRHVITDRSVIIHDTDDAKTPVGCGVIR